MTIVTALAFFPFVDKLRFSPDPWRLIHEVEDQADLLT
jgi:hypothetical protein